MEYEGCCSAHSSSSVICHFVDWLHAEHRYAHLAAGEFRVMAASASMAPDTMPARCSPTFGLTAVSSRATSRGSPPPAWNAACTAGSGMFALPLRAPLVMLASACSARACSPSSSACVAAPCYGERWGQAY